MRKRAELERLTERASKITFPTYNFLFENFKTRLSERVAENFGACEVKYDENGWFFWTVEEFVGRSAGIGLRVDMDVSLDPKLPLVQEFERIQCEYKRFRERCQEIRKAIAVLGFEEWS